MTLANVTFMTGNVREGEHVVQKNDANPAGGIPLPWPTNGAGSVGPTSGVLKTKSTPKVPPTVKTPRLIVSGSAVADGTATSTAAQTISRARIARLTHTAFDMHASLRCARSATCRPDGEYAPKARNPRSSSSVGAPCSECVGHRTVRHSSK